MPAPEQPPPKTPALFDSSPGAGLPQATPGKKDRLAKALRDNLRRRKQSTSASEEP